MSRPNSSVPRMWPGPAGGAGSGGEPRGIVGGEHAGEQGGEHEDEEDERARHHTCVAEEPRSQRGRVDGAARAGRHEDVDGRLTHSGCAGR
jgi:hypothetical protein